MATLEVKRAKAPVEEVILHLSLEEAENLHYVLFTVEAGGPPDRNLNLHHIFEGMHIKKRPCKTGVGTYNIVGWV